MIIVPSKSNYTGVSSFPTVNTIKVKMPWEVQMLSHQKNPQVWNRVSEALTKERGEIQTHAMDPGFEGNVLSLAAGKTWEFHL